MNPIVKSILVIVMLVGIIGAATYLTVKRTKPQEEGLGYTAVLMCANTSCNKIFEARIIAGQPPPYRCKYCQKMTAYRAVRCEDCGAIFPNIVREDPTRPESEEIRTTECPKCGYGKFDLVESMDEVKNPPEPAR